MSYTNSTPLLGLPQWIGTDKPTFSPDVSGGFLEIDKQFRNNISSFNEVNGRIDETNNSVASNLVKIEANTREIQNVSDTFQTFKNGDYTNFVNSTNTSISGLRSSITEANGLISANASNIVGLNTKVTALENKDSPSRTEFRAIQDNVDENNNKIGSFYGLSTLTFTNFLPDLYTSSTLSIKYYPGTMLGAAKVVLVPKNGVLTFDVQQVGTYSTSDYPYNIGFNLTGECNLNGSIVVATCNILMMGGNVRMTVNMPIPFNTIENRYYNTVTFNGVNINV